MSGSRPVASVNIAPAPCGQGRCAAVTEFQQFELRGQLFERKARIVYIGPWLASHPGYDCTLVVRSNCNPRAQEGQMKLKVLVRPEPVGGYSVSVPALPGCFSQGETLEEALDHIREAAELWLEVAETTAATQSHDENRGAELQEIEF
jgi:predicted RNase H-like HicB family nuclease